MSETGFTSLILAAAGGHLEVVKTLVEKVSIMADFCLLLAYWLRPVPLRCLLRIPKFALNTMGAVDCCTPLEGDGPSCWSGLIDFVVALPGLLRSPRYTFIPFDGSHCFFFAHFCYAVVADQRAPR